MSVVTLVRRKLRLGTNKVSQIKINVSQKVTQDGEAEEPALFDH